MAATVEAEPRPVPPRCTVFGIPFFAGSFADAGNAVVERALAGDGGYATLTSVHGVVQAQHDPEFQAALDGAWVNLPDGVPVTWAQRRLCSVGAERVCGIDLLPHVVDIGREAGLRHYLFGSSDAVLEGLAGRLRERFPGAAIAGTLSPPFGPIHREDCTDMLAEIRSASPHVVWVGLGAPKQELWMHRHAAALAPALVVGVGAAFDIVAGAQPRAPLWMQRNGLEWSYRLMREPRRLSSRYARANSEFLARFLLELGAARMRNGRAAREAR